MAPHPEIERGNDCFRDGRYDEAIAFYLAAASSIREDPRLAFNLGAAYYQKAVNALTEMERRMLLQRSAGYLGSATQALEDPEHKGLAYYNLGNALYQLERYEEAATAYMNAIELNHAHDDASYNLELALRQLARQRQRAEQAGSARRQPALGSTSSDSTQGGAAQGGGAGTPADAGTASGPGEPSPADSQPDPTRAPEQNGSSNTAAQQEGGEQATGGGSAMDNRQASEPTRLGEQHPSASPRSNTARKLDVLERRSRQLQLERLRQRDDTDVARPAERDW
ncbi:MAG: tetratricopeptide repeat protein [Pseudomonadota bacterium]